MSFRWIGGWISASLLYVLPAAAQVPGPVLDAVADLRRVAVLTGPSSSNGTATRWRVAGTDLGHMFDDGKRLYMVFGDTYGPGLTPPPGSGTTPDWRCNVMAVVNDRTPSNGLTFERMIVDTPDHAKELIPARRDQGEHTIIPTNGVATGKSLVLHYMSVKQWGPADEWTLTHSGLASSEDGGENWSRVPWTWPADSNWGQVAFVKDGGYVYLFGIPGGRKGGVKLARVSEDSLLSQDAYRYWAGEKTGWVREPARAVQIVPAPVGELSVMWNGFLKRWTLVSLSGPNIMIREAPALTGPWSEAKMMVPAGEYPGLYAPYMHPWLVENDGEIVYFTMSEWNTYNVSLMRMRLVRKPEPVTLRDVVRAQHISTGAITATTDDTARLGSPTGRIDRSSVTRLLRTLAGLG